MESGLPLNEKSSEKKEKQNGEESSVKNIQNDEKDSSKIRDFREDFKDTDRKHYNKMGFYCAIQASGDPYTEYKKLINEIQGFYSTKAKQCDERYQHTIEYIDYKITLLKNRINEEKEKLIDYHEEPEELEKARKEVEKELEEISITITDIYVKLSYERDKIIDERLEERLKATEKELNKLIDNYQILANKKYKINQELYKDNKQVFDEKVKRFSDIKQELEKIYQPLSNKIGRLSEVGFTEQSANFLILVGTAAIFAAGWFYSVFSASREMSSEDVLSFLMKRFLTFGSSQFKEGSLLINLLVFVLVWLLLLALISLVVWICREIIKKSNAPWNKIDLLISFNEEKRFAATRIESRSVFSMWMELLPILFAIGVGFILISMFGSTHEDLDTLLKSLSGQMIGTLIAFVTTGIIILYIILVIEPRLKSQSNQMDTTTPFWKCNWELTAALVGFLVLMVSIVAYSFIVQPDHVSRNLDYQQSKSAQPTTNLNPLLDNPPLTDLQKQSLNISSTASRIDPGIALASFIITVLFIGFTLGYGIRHRGMYREKERIENSIKNLSLAIETNSRPKLLDLQAIQKGVFQEKFEKCQSEFFDIIKMRNELVKEMFSDQIVKKNILIFQNPFKWLRYRQKNDEIILEAKEITSIEEKYFPHYKREIENLKLRWQQKKRDLGELNAKIKKIKNRKNELEKEIINNIDKYNSQMVDYHQEKLSCEQQWHKCCNGNLLEQQKNEIAFKDGFGLGLWYKNKGFELYFAGENGGKS